MRIMILSNIDYGLYQFRRELISSLLSCNQVTISVPNGEMVKPMEDMGCKFIDTPVDRRGLNPIKDIALFRKYMSIVENERPELVVTYTIKPNIYGGLACRIRKIPYAINITGLGTAFEKKGLLRKLVVHMYRVACKKAKVIFFENAENRQLFVDEKIIDMKQTHVLNGAGVNLEHFQLMGYPDCSNGTEFLFIGRIMKEKGIDELLTAMEKLVQEGINCNLHIVGDYEEDYKEILDQYSALGWLHYHGHQKDVRPFIEKCHCFVLPSWHEGMANTNLESAAMGRPVITSNIHGCLEAVQDNVSGYLCEKKNVESLYSAMKRFISISYEEKRAMGLAGRKHMEEMFDKEKVVDETIKALML